MSNRKHRRTQREIPQRTRSGVTLIEILVVIGIMGVLASLLMPAIQSARQAAARVQCQNNLRQIGVALTAHWTTHQVLPGGGAPSGGPSQLQPRIFDEAPAKKEHQSWGWAYQILPFLDMENRWLNPDEDAVRGSLVPFYHCTSRERQSFVFGGVTIGAMDYVGSACSNCDLIRIPGVGATEKALSWGSGGDQHDGVFVETLQRSKTGGFVVVRKPRAVEHIRDGLSLTVFVTEKRQLASSTPCNDSTGWVSGYPVTRDNVSYGHDTLFSGRDGSPVEDETDPSVQCTLRPGGPHVVGGNVLFGDGSVRFMAFGLDEDLWRALLSVNGKEDVDLIAEDVLSP